MKDELKDIIFSFAYTLAFRDATMRSAFPRLDIEKRRVCVLKKEI